MKRREDKRKSSAHRALETLSWLECLELTELPLSVKKVHLSVQLQLNYTKQTSPYDGLMNLASVCKHALNHSWALANVDAAQERPELCAERLRTEYAS
ncbi:uncharacterized [Tachysurus ichikawai]